MATNNNGGALRPKSSWIDKWIDPERYKRGSLLWWREAAIIFTIFGVTGSSSMFVTRPLIQMLGLQGFWHYVVTLLCVPPAYSMILALLARLTGRWKAFRPMIIRMWGWLFRLFGRKIH